MTDKKSLISLSEIENHIYTIRGIQVMLDSDLSELYGVDTKRINEQVRRNKDRFPEAFLFQLRQEEWDNLRSQFATSSLEHGGKRYLPFVFSEQGVAMLSAILRSETAVKVSIQIMHAFVEMRKFILGNAALFQRLDHVERKLLKADEQFELIFRALETSSSKPDKGIFFDGQVFDAYVFISDLIRSAKISITLIDNWADESVLIWLTKRNKGVRATVYSQKISKQLTLDLEKHNAQYEPIEVREFKLSHDRFLIIDEKELYHLGASFKDLGKKWFAFSRMDTETLNLLCHLSDCKFIK